ncbi:MAG: hypothetical protein WKG32_20010 [Gemmatimonadaceae bacterium]
MEEFMAVVGVFSFPLAVGFLVAWRMTRAELRRLRGDTRVAPQPVAPASADRFERLEQAVESIALEVERISEGQRFTTRLLSERQAPAERAGQR